MEVSTPQSTESTPYFQRYIQLVTADILSALPQQMSATVAMAADWSEADWSFSYAPDKWTLKESFLHLIDTERIFSYRALWIARGEQTPLPSFDHDAFVSVSSANQRTGTSLLAEYQAVRTATISLFENFSSAAWERIGTSSGGPLSVRAAAYIIAGHELHHIALFIEKYNR